MLSWGLTRRVVFKFVAVPVALLLLGMLSCLYLNVGVSASLRIDNGDLKYYLFGIPYWNSKMPQTIRQTIMSVTSEEPKFEVEWITIWKSQQEPDRRPDLLFRHFYYGAYAWANVDRRIARALLEDIANDARHYIDGAMIPKSYIYLIGGNVIVWEHGAPIVRRDWLDVENGALAYLTEKNISGWRTEDEISENMPTETLQGESRRDENIRKVNTSDKGGE